MKKIFFIIVIFLVATYSYAQDDYIEFVPGDSFDSLEKKYMFYDQGSLFGLDNGAHRFADGNNYFIYKIDLMGLDKEVLILDICHDYKVEMSYNGSDYFVVLESPEDVHDDSNRGPKFIDLRKYIKNQQVIYLKFTDRTPANGWGSCLYSFYLGSAKKKKVKTIHFSGESYFGIQNTTTRGTAKDITYDKEWFGYLDKGVLFRRSNFYQNLKLYMNAGIMNKFLLNAEFMFDKFNSAWDYEKKEPIENYQPIFDSEAFRITLQTIQENKSSFRNKITIGKIYPQYSTLTMKKRHNGFMWESESSRTKITATGARLQHFNDVNQYLASGRGETKFGETKLGVSCVMNRFDAKSVASKNDSLYGQRDGQYPAVYVRFRDRTPADWWGAKVWNVQITNFVNGVGSLYDQFSPGDNSEAKYLFDVHGNYYLDSGAKMRRADENGYFIYRFPLNNTGVENIRFNVEVSQDYVLEVSLDGINYQVISEGNMQNDNNQGIVSFDVPLLPKITTATNMYVTISDDSPGDGWAGDLYRLEYYENDQLKISFSPDESPSSTESKYIVAQTGNYANGHRYADSGPFTYRIPVSVDLSKIKLKLDIQHDYKIEVKLPSGLIKTVHAPGNVKNDSNRKIEEIDFSSYDVLYKNTYIKSGTTVVGFDLNTKILDTEISGEFARSIEHRIYPGDIRENPGFNAYHIGLKRQFKFLSSELMAKYLYLDPNFDSSISVDVNKDNDELIDELEPNDVTRPGLEYDPLKDMNNNNLNDEDEVDMTPDYIYRINQKGYILQDSSKLTGDLTTLLNYSEIQEITTSKVGQKFIGRLDFYKTFISDSSFVGRYRFAYIKDKRSLSQNPDNLRNYFKFMFYDWGIKPFDIGIGLERIEFNRNLMTAKTTLENEFVIKSRCQLHPVNRLLVMPMFQIIFTRKMYLQPDHDMYEEYNQYIPGFRVEYKLTEKAFSYINYRYVYTFDMRYPVNHNYYDMFEIGMESTGTTYIRVYYRFLDQIFTRVERKNDSWKSGNFFGEVRFWF